MKPHVICHMMSSLDGKLHVDQWSETPGVSSDERTAEYERVHDALNGDAWLAGRVTMAEFTSADAHPPHDIAPHDVGPRDIGMPGRPHHFANRDADGYAIAVDTSGKLHWTGGDIDGEHIVVLLGADVADAHLAELAGDGVSYIVSDAKEIDLAAALDTLGRELGIKTLLLEGGAGINGAFLKAGLVDEISLLMFPAIDGHTGSRTIFEGGEEGLADSVALTLSSVEKGEAGSVHLRYTVARPA